jgi:hypothetical protein
LDFLLDQAASKVVVTSLAGTGGMKAEPSESRTVLLAAIKVSLLKWA